MKAVLCTRGELHVADVPDPEPERGQLVVEVLRAGICGSDLHARTHCDELADIGAEVGYDALMRSDQDVVLGHEFCAEVVDSARGTRNAPRAGTRVVSFPLLRRAGQVHATGLSAAAPGAYAERMLVQAALTLPVPNGLPTGVAALTEPMAVALHAVRRGEVGPRTTAVVIGCGPVGLAVIGMLKATGVRHVIASDLSAGRRALAAAMGADLVVDPAQDSPYATLGERGYLTSAASVFELAVGGMERLRSVPFVPWQHVYRAAELAGVATPKHPVVFECVGVPGLLEQVISGAPLYSRVVVVGVCMQPDRIRPAMAINKELDLRFVLGYTPREFRDALHLLADGKVDGRPLLTGEVGLGGVAAAFTALADPEAHAKILIDPRSDAVAPS